MSKSNSRLNQSIGAFQEINFLENQVIIDGENGILKLTSPIQNVVRIQANEHSKTDLEPLPSYALSNSVENHSIDNIISAKASSSIQLSVGEIQVNIEKSTSAISFNDSQGNIINEDDSLGISWLNGEVSCYKKIQENERFIGLGEKTGSLDRKGQAFVNWNTDKFAYGIDDDPIYASIPFYMGVHNGQCYGIFLDNTARTTFNFGASNNRFMYFSSENGTLDYYFIYGENVTEVLTKYNILTGTMELPPIWSLGLQQCRYSYYPDTEVLSVAENFRARKIPADLIYLDIHYMDAYKVFTFDQSRFPDPKGLADKLKDHQFELAVIVDPGVKKEEGYPTYDEGLNQQCFVQYPDGEPYTANVWPGESCFPDFTNPKARAWWGSQFGYYTSKGIHGFWNDMNEPASWGQHTPDLIEFDYEGVQTSHKDARNVYGMQMARATFDGAKKQLDNLRPFILTRAGYAGIQRYAAVWTGDNVASDEHMLLGVRLLNSLSISGVPFCGYDVGGFAGEATPELFARWIVLGAFSPMFRCHSMINTRDAEPWSFGEQVEIISRNYTELRYRLMPLIYSKFHASSLTGAPIQKSLAVDYPFDDQVFNPNYQNQYVFCDSIMVIPTESTEKIKKYYIPNSSSGQINNQNNGDEHSRNNNNSELWYHLFTDQKIMSGEHYQDTPIDKIPLLVKEGSIIPMQSVVQSTKEKPHDTLELHVYKATNHKTSKLEYYEDDGVSYDYKEQQYYRRTIELSDEKLLISEVLGKRNSKFKTVKVLFHGFNPLQIVQSSETYAFFGKMPAFDPFYEPEDPAQIIDLQSLTLPWKNQAIIVELNEK